MTSVHAPSTSTTDPEWNEQFDLDVQDANQSQLEVTLWDSTEERPVNNSNFLGEVIINVSKLVPFAGSEVQQYFAVKTGKSVQIDYEATGQLMLTLKYLTPELAAIPGATKVADSKPVGLTLSIEEEWEKIKPRYAEFERQAAADFATILSLSTGSPRIEVVGCQRWVDDRQQQRGTQLHVNLHPGPDPADLRSTKSLKEDLVAAWKERSSKLTQSTTLANTVDITLHQPYKKSVPQPSSGARTGFATPRPSDMFLELKEIQSSRNVKIPWGPGVQCVFQGMKGGSPAAEAVKTKSVGNSEGASQWDDKLFIPVQGEGLDSLKVELFTVSNGVQGGLVAEGATSLQQVFADLGKARTVGVVLQDKAGHAAQLQLNIAAKQGTAPKMVVAAAPVAVEPRKMSHVHSIAHFSVSGSSLASAASQPKKAEDQTEPPVPSPPSSSQRDAGPLPVTPASPSMQPKSSSSPALHSHPAPSDTPSMAAPSAPPPPPPEAVRSTPPRSPSSLTPQARVSPAMAPQQQPPSTLPFSPLRQDVGLVADCGLVVADSTSPSSVGELVVEEVLANGPAEQSRLVSKGDILKSVDGRDVGGMPASMAQDLLRGKDNSPVTLTLLRGQLGIQNVTVLRDTAPYNDQERSQRAAGKISDEMKAVFPAIAFLWTGEQAGDAQSLTDWKDDALYGPKWDPEHPPPMPDPPVIERPPDLPLESDRQQGHDVSAPTMHNIYTSGASFLPAGGLYGNSVPQYSGEPAYGGAQTMPPGVLAPNSGGAAPLYAQSPPESVQHMPVQSYEGYNRTAPAVAAVPRSAYYTGGPAPGPATQPGYDTRAYGAGTESAEVSSQQLMADMQQIIDRSRSLRGSSSNLVGSIA